MDLKQTIIDLLGDTGRPGIEDLIEAMDAGGFFEAPCSTQYHLSGTGGLAEHSANVYQTMLTLDLTLKAKLPRNSIIICGLLHDLGKMGDHGKPNYVDNILKSGKQSESKPYITNPALAYLPHEVRSVMIAERYIDLTEEEEQAILWHNGLYSSFKYDIPGKETPMYMIMHFADLWASRVIEKNNEEERS